MKIEKTNISKLNTNTLILHIIGILEGKNVLVRIIMHPTSLLLFIFLYQLPTFSLICYYFNVLYNFFGN